MARPVVTFVYVVIDARGEGDIILGVYSTRAAALRRIGQLERGIVMERHRVRTR